MLCHLRQSLKVDISLGIQYDLRGIFGGHFQNVSLWPLKYLRKADFESQFLYQAFQFRNEAFFLLQQDCS